MRLEPLTWAATSLDLVWTLGMKGLCTLRDYDDGEDGTELQDLWIMGEAVGDSVKEVK